MNYCIVDDEPIAHRIIEGYCDKLAYLEKVGNCFSAFEAMELFNTQIVDLMFLDINMPNLSGFELLKTMQHPPNVIVTTAYKEYALEGYELNVSDYLLKPFSFQRFLIAIQKVTENQIPSTRTVATEDKKSSFFLKGDKKTHQIHYKDILFVEAYGNYSKVILTNEMIVCHEKISSLEQLLSSREFLRIHKSFIVAVDRINAIEGNRVWIGGHKLPVGQTYKRGLKGWLSE